MKANLTLLVLSILVSISIFSCTEKKETPKEATLEELSQMNRDFVKALNAKDAVAAANCYTEDATLLPPNEAPVKGRANIQKNIGKEQLRQEHLMQKLRQQKQAVMAT